MPTNNAIDLTSQGIAYYNGTTAFSGIDGSTAGRILISNGTGVAPSFQTSSSGSGVSGFVASGQVGSSSDPLDSTTYYFAYGQTFTSITLSTDSIIRYVVPTNFTLNRVFGVVSVFSTKASAQNCTVFIRKNNSTNTNITTTLQLTGAVNSFSNTSVGLALVAGDYISFGFTGPAWTTNPSQVEIAIGFSD